MAKETERSLEQLFTEIVETMNHDPSPFADQDVVYCFELRGEEGGQFLFTLSGGKAEITSYSTDVEADCILQMKVSDFKKLITRQLKGASAFMLGKLKIKGNLGLALKLDQLLDHYSFER